MEDQIIDIFTKSVNTKVFGDQQKIPVKGNGKIMILCRRWRVKI